MMHPTPGAVRLGLAALFMALHGCEEPAPPAAYDVVIRDGMIYDGSGSDPYLGDLGISNDTIAAISTAPLGRGRQELDAGGLAVAPGFINVDSRAYRSLLKDGRATSDVRQGVTLEVFGAGWSMGPLSLSMKQAMSDGQDGIDFPVEWTSLGDYVEHLASRGVSANIAAFVGATTLRVHVLGYHDRSASRSELEEMRRLARDAMRQGALGVASSLAEPPGSYADTQELIALAQVASQFGGLYASQVRSSGGLLLQAVDELITVASEAQLPAVIQQLGAAGQENWTKLDSVFRRVQRARAEGVSIWASTAPYTGVASHLAAALPPRLRDLEGLPRLDRLRELGLRPELMQEMAEPSEMWESPYRAAGSAENVMLMRFRNPTLRPLAGTTLAAAAVRRGATPTATAIDLMLEDEGPVGAVFFVLSQQNVEEKIRQPWMTIGSGAPASSAEAELHGSTPHPAAFGSFARILSAYVREDSAIALPEAIRRLTSLPAAALGIGRRGSLRPGFFADVVVFDPASVQDHADYRFPQRYATGVRHVLVNGRPVLRDGEHTGATPGRVIRGPGWTRHGERAVEPGPD